MAGRAPLTFGLFEQTMAHAIDWASEEINAFENTKTNKTINIYLRPSREPGRLINPTADFEFKMIINVLHVQLKTGLVFT